MSTKSRLIIFEPDKNQYSSVHVHWGGHPDERMPLLNKYFNTQQSVERLFKEDYINNTNNQAINQSTHTIKNLYYDSPDIELQNTMRSQFIDDSNLGYISSLFVDEVTDKCYLLKNFKDYKNNYLHVAPTIEDILQQANDVGEWLDYLYLWNGSKWIHSELLENGIDNPIWIN
jgi:hypothetical protein